MREAFMNAVHTIDWKIEYTVENLTDAITITHETNPNPNLDVTNVSYD